MPKRKGVALARSHAGGSSVRHHRIDRQPAAAAAVHGRGRAFQRSWVSLSRWMLQLARRGAWGWGRHGAGLSGPDRAGRAHVAVGGPLTQQARAPNQSGRLRCVRHSVRVQCSCAGTYSRAPRVAGSCCTERSEESGPSDPAAAIILTLATLAPT